MGNNYFDNQRKNILSNILIKNGKETPPTPFSKEKINKGIENEGTGEEKVVKISPDKSNEDEKTENEKATPEQIEKLKKFIKQNNYLDDDAFHLYATEIGLNPHEAEEAVYQILHDLFSEENLDKILDGKSKNYTPEEIAEKHGLSLKQLQKQINIGVQVEKEHTKDEATALTITLDHLVEEGDYYTNKKPKNWGEKEIKKEKKSKTEDEESKEVKKAIIAEKGELFEKAYADGTRVKFKDGWYTKTKGEWKKEKTNLREIPIFSGIFKELNKYGIEFEIDPNNKVSPIQKVFVKPNQSNEYYSKVNDVLDRYNLRDKKVIGKKKNNEGKLSNEQIFELIDKVIPNLEDEDEALLCVDYYKLKVEKNRDGFHIILDNGQEGKGKSLLEALQVLEMNYEPSLTKDLNKSNVTSEEYTKNLSKALQFDNKGNIKLNKEQNERLNKLSESEIEKFFTVLTGINKPETLKAFKKLDKEAKINALAFYIAKQGVNRKKEVEEIFKPHEGELRHFSDGDYIYAGGHWKKIKI